MKTMVDKTQKELLISLIEMQGKHGNDLAEIKTCLLGDDYHPEGLVNQTNKNTDCISKIKRSQAKREGIIGTITVFFTASITMFLNWIFYWKQHGV